MGAAEGVRPAGGVALIASGKIGSELGSASNGSSAQLLPNLWDLHL